MASIYEQSMALQAHLYSVEYKDKESELLALAGLAAINDRWDSSVSRVAHSDSAFYIADKLTEDSIHFPVQRFGEVILKGHVPRITCINLASRLTLALPFFDAVVIGPYQEIEPELVDYELDGYDVVLPLDVPIRRPLYTPIEQLRFIMLVA